jgi:hypothetical protein
MPGLRHILTLMLAAPAICSAQATIAPGLWQITLQSSSAVVAMPPAQINQCLTAADASDPSQLLGSIASPGASACIYSNKSYAGNTFSFAMTCEGTFAIKATGSVSFTATSLSGTINTSANINGQPVAMKNAISARRVGECG